MAGLEKKVMYRYSGNGKFAVRKQEKQQEAIERNNAYQKKISTVKGIMEYMNINKNIGKRQLGVLEAKLLYLRSKER